MNIILLSGGSGKRLWPLSNEIRSKQFLKLLQSPTGEYESMVQRVYRQIQEAGIEAPIIVATGASQIDSIISQLGCKVEVVLEPERRNTFPAVVLSSAYLALEKGVGLDEVVVVLPVDPYADLEYFTTLIRMESAVKENVADLVLMGIVPSYPSSKYGYIIPSDDQTNDLKLVAHFVEKPSEEHASVLISDGA
jgi:mannose-1-phosphate guanylyltransferase